MVRTYQCSSPLMDILPELMGDGTRYKSVQYHVCILTRDTHNRDLQASAVRTRLGRYEVSSGKLNRGDIFRKSLSTRNLDI